MGLLFLSYRQISSLLPFPPPSPDIFPLFPFIFFLPPLLPVFPLDIFSSAALFSLSLPHSDSPFVHLTSSIFPLLLHVGLSFSPLSFSPHFLPHLFLVPHPHFSPLSLLPSFLSPSVSLRFNSACFSSLSPIIPHSCVPVAVPQAVGRGGRWMAG